MKQDAKVWHRNYMEDGMVRESDNEQGMAMEIASRRI
jgi:hypothetical protein